MKYLRIGLITTLLIALGAGAAWAWGDAGECVTCHTSMTIGGELHTAHNTFITDCGWCHTTDGDPAVSTNSSDNDPENSCTGCHNLGGLYPIHTVENCGCHGLDPPAPINESDLPPYYNTAATSLTNPCNDNLDNDGDGLVDRDDTDCPSVDVEWKSWSSIKEAYGE